MYPRSYIGHWDQFRDLVRFDEDQDNSILTAVNKAFLIDAPLQAVQAVQAVQCKHCSSMGSSNIFRGISQPSFRELVLLGISKEMWSTALEAGAPAIGSKRTTCDKDKLNVHLWGVKGASQLR